MSGGPYRTPAGPLEPLQRSALENADAALVLARSRLIDAISEGVRKANALAPDESSLSYKERIGALESLHKEVMRHGR